MSTTLLKTSRRSSARDSQSAFQPKVGDVVRIASPDQIMLSLDQNGHCNGMPLMPEMLRYCGQAFPVLRWANTVCVFGKTVQFRHLDDCVVLQMPRCCGSAHEGCQMACTFFWNTRWLLPSSDDAAIIRPSPPPQLVTLLHSKTKTEAGFQCQATQLGVVTSQDGGAIRRLGDEYNLNRVRLTRFASDFCSTLLAKATRTQDGLSGPCVGRTPVCNLNLQVGDSVRVRSKSEIRATLNSESKNRGMWFDPAMLRYCGTTMRVTRRVEQFINEETGQMIRPAVPSIVLDEQHCSGNGRRFCSRLLHFFWREVWLERA